jgi:hypothetical protein
LRNGRLQLSVSVQVDAGDGQTAFKLHAAPDRLELLLPCVLFGVRSHREPLMAEVAMNLDFAPRLHAAAKRITGGQMRRISGELMAYHVDIICGSCLVHQRRVHTM